MIGEIELIEVMVPAALVWAIVAGLLIIPLRRALQWFRFYRLVWHPALFDLALFFILWTGLSVLAEGLPPALSLP